MTFKPNKAYWLSIAAASLLCLTAVSQVSAQTLKGDWTMTNFDVKGGRYNPFETTLNRKTVKSLQLAWKADINPAYSPAIANGVVYSSSDDGHFYALDAATGQTVWSVNLGAGAASSPAVMDGGVYTSRWSGQLIALNMADGSTLWSTNLDSKTTYAPIAAGGRVFISDIDGSYYAFNARTGKRLWKADNNQEGGVDGVPVVSHGTVYAQTRNTSLYAYDAATGSMKWKYVGGGVEPGSLATDGHSVYFGANGITAINADTGALEWFVGTGKGVMGTDFALVKHRLRVPAFNEWWTLGTRSGTVLGLKYTDYVAASAPTIANGVLYAISGNGVIASDMNSGTILWSAPIVGALAEVGPVVSHGRVYVVAGSSLYAFALKD